MRLYRFVKVAFPGLVLAVACFVPVSSHAQAARSITLDPPAGLELQDHLMDSKGNVLPAAPANFRRLGEATVGQQADLHTLTLRFSQTTRITGISVTKDFKVEQGGSCFEGNLYAKGTTCSLLVRFTPQGPGNRLGKLTVTHSASPTPDAFGLGGYGYSPIISFVPSVIATVPGTYPSSVGLLSGAQNLTVDGGDTIWISDTGNGLVRNIDSSGTIQTLASGYTGALGIAVDTFGEAYFDVPSTGKMYEIFGYGPVVQASGTGSDSCPSSAPCTLSAEALGTPGEMSMDPYNHLFFVDSHSGAAFSTVQPEPANLIYLYDPFPYQQTPSAAMAVDAGDNLYTLWANGGVCAIEQQSLYNAENSNVSFNKVAGGHACGFSGDGGLAGNAEIGAKIGQIAFDVAGDLYFTDLNNQRVRRIDYNTGIIRTIAGNGTAGFTGDGGGSPVAELSSPTGVAVDSQGQVYIISSAASGQVVRKMTATGYKNVGTVPKGVKGPAATVIVTNTGNSVMMLTNTTITGANAADFSVDPGTTSCILSPGAVLYSGQTCQIGFILTPSGTGNRNANFVMLNNTINNSNVIQLTGTGSLATATFTITSPTNGSSYTSGSSVPFSAKVTSTSGPAPTGTVQFKVDGANYGSAVTLSSGTASTSVTGLTQTSHTLSATYSGDSNYAAGGPISVSITVTAVIGHQPTVTMSPMARTSMSCVPQTFNVTVAGTSGVVPTGTVNLLDGSRSVSTANLVNGKAVLSSPPLLAGQHTFTTRYGGDAYNLAAVSPALVETISQSGPCNQQPAGPVGVR